MKTDYDRLGKRIQPRGLGGPGGPVLEKKKPETLTDMRGALEAFRSADAHLQERLDSDAAVEMAREVRRMFSWALAEYSGSDAPDLAELTKKLAIRVTG